MTEQEQRKLARKLYRQVFGQELDQVFQEAMSEGVIEAICPSCGVSASVEPDGEYECYHCKAGMLISPLVAFHLI